MIRFEMRELSSLVTCGFLVGAPALGLTGCGAPADDASPPAVTDGTLGVADTDAGADPVILAAGDIATCSSSNDTLTANLVKTLPGTVLLLGDNAYESGSAKEYADCFDPSWGAFRNRTKPSPGNHEYGTSKAAGYFGYFGAAAGDPKKGYYSYDVGSWHIVSLNSNCDDIGGCDAGSPQEKWLRSDLAAHPAACTLAYFHHPRFSSGFHGNDDDVDGLWRALYDADADVILNGHDHDYERFVAQDPDGRADATRGITQFVVGTGGKDLRPFLGSAPKNSRARNADTYGVLQMTLHSNGYDFVFRAAKGSFGETGTGACH